MLDFQQKRKIRAVMYNRVTLVLLFILATLAIHSTWKVYRKERATSELKAASLERVGELQARDQEIDSKIDRLNTPAGVEEEIRSKFNVAKEGENIVIVLDEEGQNNPHASSSSGFWQKIWRFILR